MNYEKEQPVPHKIQILDMENMNEEIVTEMCSNEYNSEYECDKNE